MQSGGDERSVGGRRLHIERWNGLRAGGRALLVQSLCVTFQAVQRSCEGTGKGNGAGRSSRLRAGATPGPAAWRRLRPSCPPPGLPRLSCCPRSLCIAQHAASSCRSARVQKPSADTLQSQMAALGSCRGPARAAQAAQLQPSALRHRQAAGPGAGELARRAARSLLAPGLAGAQQQSPASSQHSRPQCLLAAAGRAAAAAPRGRRRSPLPLPPPPSLLVAQARRGGDYDPDYVAFDEEEDWEEQVGGCSHAWPPRLDARRQLANRRRSHSSLLPPPRRAPRCRRRGWAPS